jgi:hypothetical protein
LAPKLITWSDDKTKKAYQGVQTKSEEDLRTQFAKWMTSPDNPRFAMTIANRMWKRAFGVGVKEPVTDLDDPSCQRESALLHHLAAEMVRLKFDLKQFMRLLCNTQAYQREATSHEISRQHALPLPRPDPSPHERRAGLGLLRHARRRQPMWTNSKPTAANTTPRS